MRVIPVIDLQQGAVVRGVAGERARYRPIESQLTDSSEPAAVASALRREFALDEIYLADLDAIAASEPNWPAYESVAASIPRLWVDAGVSDVARADQLAQATIQGRPIDQIVFGLESVASPALLEQALASVGPKRAVFSLDLKQGQPLASGAAWLGLSAEQIAELAGQIGFRRFIVLDLACVGVGQGPGGETVCRFLRRAVDPLELVAGGGVRNLDDLRRLSDAGCDAALVASALHDGRLRRVDLDSL